MAGSNMFTFENGSDKSLSLIYPTFRSASAASLRVLSGLSSEG